MSFDKILTIISFVLAVPSFLILFFGPFYVAAVITLLLAFVSLLAAYNWRRLLLPEFDMLSTRGELVIHDATGTKATFSRKIRFRPNYRHSREIKFENIRADGPTSNFRWNGAEIPNASIKNVLGADVVTVELGPMERGREYSGTLSYEHGNSFPGNQEFIGYLVSRPTRRASMHVHLPAGRPCKRAGARQKIGEQEELYKSPKVSDDKQTIELQIDRPVLGWNYMLSWEW